MNDNPVDEEAKEIMRQYYAGLMAQQPDEFIREPRFTEAERVSPEYEQVNRARLQAGMPPISNRAGRRVQTAISLTEDEAEALRDLAAQWGYIHGGRGNLSAFFAAIALGDLTITPRYGAG